MGCLDGAGRDRRRPRRQHGRQPGPLHRLRLGRRPRQAAGIDRSARGPDPLRRLPGAAACELPRARRLPRALLPLPRGHRPLAAAATRGRGAGNRAGSGRRSRIRVRRRGEDALAGTQPLVAGPSHLSGRPAGPARPGAAGDRAGADPGLDCRRLGPPEAARRPRRAPPPALDAARPAPDSERAHDLGRRLRGPFDRRPRLALLRPRRPFEALRACLRAYWRLVRMLLGRAT